MMLIREQLNQLNEDDIKVKTDWSMYHTLVHCAETIEYSMNGYPEMKPAFLRATVGKLAIKKFLRQGYMKHSLVADVAGGRKIKEDGSFEEGKNILLSMIDEFLNYKGKFAPHLLFGNLSREEYDQYFVLHIQDHFSEL